MIDIENKVIDTITNVVGSSAMVVGEYTQFPADFPCVMVMQTDNAALGKSVIGTGEEHVRVNFQVDVFSNKASGAKSEVKALFDTVDAAMRGMKFTRESFSFQPNWERDIKRGVARYSAIVGKAVTSDGTTTYQIYRR